MCSPHVLELISGVRVEAIVTTVSGVTVVRSTDLNHSSVVRIEGEESVVEFALVKSSVSALVVPCNEEFKLCLGWEDTDGVKARSKLVGVDSQIVVGVEHLEGVGEVKVRLGGKCCLLCFDVILVADKVSETIDKLILVRAREHGLTAGA